MKYTRSSSASDLFSAVNTSRRRDRSSSRTHMKDLDIPPQKAISNATFNRTASQDTLRRLQAAKVSKAALENPGMNSSDRVPAKRSSSGKNREVDELVMKLNVTTGTSEKRTSSSRRVRESEDLNVDSFTQKKTSGSRRLRESEELNISANGNPIERRSNLSRTKSMGSVMAMNRAREGGRGSLSSSSRKSPVKRVVSHSDIDMDDSDQLGLARVAPDRREIWRSKSSDGMPVPAREPGRLRMQRVTSKSKILRKMSDDTMAAMEARSKSYQRRASNDGDSRSPNRRSSNNKDKKGSSKSPKRGSSKKGLKRVSSLSSRGSDPSLPVAVLVDSLDESSHGPSLETPAPAASSTWTCLCGLEMKECMKFCGMCATPQNWTCVKCEFDKNVCSFRFCGGCAAPKPAEDATASTAAAAATTTSNKLVQETPVSPTSPLQLQ